MNTSTDLGAIAARMQERAILLVTEQTKLSVSEKQLQTVLDEEQKELSINNDIRRNLLLATNSRNGVELELYDAKDKVADYTRKIDQLKFETETIQKESHRTSKQWESDVQNIYSRHQLSMEVYEQAWGLALEDKARIRKEREERISDLQSCVHEVEDQRETIRAESDRLREELAILESGNGADKEVFTLSTQIQAAVTQVRLPFFLFPSASFNLSFLF